MLEERNKFVSLGPFCLSASILEYAKLRDGSYPLDWAQSGYTTIKELLELDKEAFYYRNIYTPSIHFYQSRDGKNSRSDMFPLISSAETNLFGYPYFYNPHRKLGIESKEYFMRTLRRWENSTSLGLNVTFLLADYMNNPGNIFFDDAEKQLAALSGLLSSKLACRHRIILVRLRLDSKQAFLHCEKVDILHKGILQMNICYPVLYQKAQTLHDMAAAMIGIELKKYLRASSSMKIDYVQSICPDLKALEGNP